MEPQNTLNKNSELYGNSRKSQGVLIAAQDPVVGELLGRFLEKKGYRFELVDSWDRVQEKAQYFQPEVLILGALDSVPSGNSPADEIRQLVGEESLPALILAPYSEEANQNNLLLKDPLDWEELDFALRDLTRSQIGGKALLINADPIFNAVLGQQFERVGWRTTLVPHIQSALKKISQEAPDLIFMETRPGINDILSVISNCPRVSLFLLATNAIKKEDESRLAEFNPVVFRPGHFSLKELKEALDSRVS